MELTNYSFLNSRRDYLNSSAKMKIASDRLSNGDRLESDKNDTGALGVKANLQTSDILNRAERINLQNFHTFLQGQGDGLQKARHIYERMSILASKALDTTINEQDRYQLNREFSELSSELDNLVRKKINGNLLFGGKSADFTDGLTDTNATGATPLREVQNVESTSGKISLSLSPGTAADQIWIFQGELPSEFDEYFDSSTYLNTGSNHPTDIARLNELNSKLYNLFNSQGIFTTGPWQSVGSANSNNFDTFHIEFDSCNVKVTTEFDPDNQASFGQNLYDSLSSTGELRTKVPSGDSTMITMIGVNSGNTAIYNVKASFTPTLPYNDIEIPSSGQVFPAISFGNLGCNDISTHENATEVLGALEAELSNLSSSVASIAAAQARYEYRIESLGELEISNEASRSRISDTDFAKEAINFSKSSLKTELATQMMSKSSRLKDVLIELTTNHFRSHVLKARI